MYVCASVCVCSCVCVCVCVHVCVCVCVCVCVHVCVCICVCFVCVRVCVTKLAECTGDAAQKVVIMSWGGVVIKEGVQNCTGACQVAFHNIL